MGAKSGAIGFPGDTLLTELPPTPELWRMFIGIGLILIGSKLSHSIVKTRYVGAKMNQWIRLW